MTSRERVTRALRFEPVDRIPIDNEFGGELERKYPSDVAIPPYHYPPGRSWGEAYRKGRRMDDWGCVWVAGEDGVVGEVKESPLAGESWAGLGTFQPPWEVVEGADLSGVNAACAASDKFMIARWVGLPNLFERMQHLRGSEQLYLDLALQEPELFRLRDLVHEYFMRQLELWVRTDVDAVHLADDWGSQQSLLISPEMWRAIFKPLYKEYCDLAHRHGKFVLMHSDGYIKEIIPDLIEIGVNAVNAQLFIMPMEELAEEFAGKICFWGEIDRQRLLTSGTPDEVRAGVRRVAQAFLKKGRTGVVGQCFPGKDHRPENNAAVFEEWSKV